MQKEPIDSIYVKPDKCVTARGKQEIHVELKNNSIALIIYAAIPGYRNSPGGHRKIIHIEKTEFIKNLLQQAFEDLRGEEFKIILLKPAANNANETQINALITNTKRIYTEIFQTKRIEEEKIGENVKLCVNGQIENYKIKAEKPSFHSLLKTYFSNR